jgi:transcriptional regulator with XRE-family HTH domain
MVKKVSALLRELQADGAYWDAWLIGDFAEELSERMRQENISRSALAKKLGTSQAYITKILRGDTNFTIRSMTQLARAVNSVVRVHLAPAGSSTKRTRTRCCVGSGASGFSATRRQPLSRVDDKAFRSPRRLLPRRH